MKLFQSQNNRLDMHSNFQVNIFWNICTVTSDVLEGFSEHIIVYNPHPHPSSNNKTLNARLLCRDTSLSQELHYCSYPIPKYPFKGSSQNVTVLFKWSLAQTTHPPLQMKVWKIEYRCIINQTPPNNIGFRTMYSPYACHDKGSIYESLSFQNHRHLISSKCKYNSTNILYQ